MRELLWNGKFSEEFHFLLHGILALAVLPDSPKMRTPAKLRKVTMWIWPATPNYLINYFLKDAQSAISDSLPFLVVNVMLTKYARLRALETQLLSKLIQYFLLHQQCTLTFVWRDHLWGERLVHSQCPFDLWLLCRDCWWSCQMWHIFKHDASYIRNRNP